VIIANRSRERADQLAAALGGSASSCSWDDLVSGRVTGDVLANSTSLGMTPNVEESPVPAHVAAQVLDWVGTGGDLEGQGESNWDGVARVSIVREARETRKARVFGKWLSARAYFGVDQPS
jgi:hypothetical protein